MAASTQTTYNLQRQSYSMRRSRTKEISYLTGMLTHIRFALVVVGPLTVTQYSSTTIATVGMVCGPNAGSVRASVQHENNVLD